MIIYQDLLYIVKIFLASAKYENSYTGIIFQQQSARDKNIISSWQITKKIKSIDFTAKKYTITSNQMRFDLGKLKVLFCKK